MINESNLSKATLPKLLKGFEVCVDHIFKSRALMFKIVSQIDTRNLFAKKSVYTKKQLRQLATRGITEPWNETTRTVMVNLYSHFSWSQYVKYGMLAAAIPTDVAERVSEDALILLNRKRTDIKKILPAIKKTEGVITRELVQKVVDTKLAKPVTKKVANKTKTLSPEKAIANKTKTLSPEKAIAMLTKALGAANKANAKLNDEVVATRKENRRLRKIIKETTLAI